MPNSKTRLAEQPEEFASGCCAGVRSCGRAPSAMTAARARSRKVFAVFARRQRHRRAEAHRADHGHGQQRALRQAAMQVVEIHGNQFHGRKLAGRAGTVRCENAPAPRSVPRVPSGKMISESPSRKAARNGSSGSDGVSSRDAIDEHGAEAARGDVLAQALAPVIARRDGPGARAQAPRQRRPDRQGVDVAGVIGEVDALAGAGVVPIQRAYAPTSSLTTPTSSALEGRIISAPSTAVQSRGCACRR